MNKRQLGTVYEQKAAAYLQQQGYEIMECNFRCRMGEIDIIAREGEYLCFVEVKYQINTVLKSLKMLVTGKVSANEVSGPVGIVSAIGDTYEASKSEGTYMALLSLINMAIMLSANLGVMNLLPLPALDGGRIVFCIIEVIKGKPVSRDKEGMVHFIGFALLMVLMVFLIFNDVRKLL